MKTDIQTLDAKKAGTVDLSDEIFGLEPRGDILHRMVTYQLAKRRAGTHKTKGRAEINRTGARFGRQKGGGRARHGSRRVGIFVGGGKAHGPVVRSHATSLPKKVRAGLVIHACAIRHAIEAGYSNYDFLAGTTRYKMQLANEVRPIMQLSMRRNSLRTRISRVQTAGMGVGRALRAGIRQRIGERRKK